MKKIANPWLKTHDYNCVGCCPDNKNGLHLVFWEDGDDIVTRWSPSRDWQSWSNTLHGGIQGLLVDEIAGWVVFRKLQTTGVTSKMEVKYLKTVVLQQDYITLRARINKMMRNVAFIDVELYNQQGELCTQASTVYFCASQEKARESGMPECLLEEEETAG